MEKQTFLHVAQIIGAHGVKGELKVVVLSENKDRLQELSELSLLTAGGLFVKKVRFTARRMNNFELIKIEGLDDRDEALALKNHYLSVSRDEAAPLPEGRYYVSDLIGLKVIDAERGEIGRLKDISDNGAQDIYEIARPKMKALYLAISPETFLDADLNKGEIHVQLPHGLWEIYD